MPHRFEQLRHAPTGRGGDAKERQLQLGGAARERLDVRISRVAIDRIDLVGGDELRLGGERRLKELELATDGLEILHGVASTRAGDIDQMHEHLRPFEVAQELMAETLSAMRTLDQSGHVGDDEAAIVAQAHDAEIRWQDRKS